MGTVEDCLRKARRTFDRMIASPEESLSKAELLELVGGEQYDLVRGALLATEKVDSATGRAGGLTIRRSQGNRREWNQTADAKARRYLEDQEPPRDETAVAALREIYEEWPQSRIAEVLGVSQPTVSTWLRTNTLPPKFEEAVRKLKAELETGRPSRGGARRAPSEERVEVSQYGDWLRAELERRQINAIDLSARSGVGIGTLVALLEGRTERPQQRTRDRIEKALASAPPGDSGPTAVLQPPEKDTWYYMGLPWTREEIDQVPDEPGVYIIHDRLGRPAYVGVAHKGAGGIRARLRKHDELRWTADRRVARSFSYALSGRMPSHDASTLAKSLEKLLIKFMGNAILINEREVEDLAE